MGWFGLKSKAKHDDPEIRLSAVAGMSDQSRLLTLARHDPDARVRAAAAGRITRTDALRELMANGDEAVRRITREKLSAMADDIVRARPLAEAQPFLDAISDQKSLAELSLRAVDSHVRAAALDKLLSASEPSEALLAMVAIQHIDPAIAVRPVARIAKRKILKDIVGKAKTPAAQQAASERLTEIEQAASGRPNAEAAARERRAGLDQALDKAMRLAVGGEAERGPEAWIAVQVAWDVAWSQHAWLAHDAPDHERQQRFARAHSDAKAQWVKAAAIAAERSAATAAAQAAAQAAHAQAQAAVEAAASSIVVPPELLTVNAEAEALITASGDRLEAKHRFALLHKQWLNLAADLPFEHRERLRFPEAYAQFKQVGRAAREQREAGLAERMDALTALCQQAEQLADSAIGNDPAAANARSAAVTNLQRQWRAVGRVPAAKLAAIKERFLAALDRAWAPLREREEGEDWARMAHAAKAEDAIAAVEATATLELPAVLPALKAAQLHWKNAGPLPRSKSESLWARWKAAQDAAYARLQPWFAEQDAARASNLEARLKLLEEAEALAKRGPVGLAGSPADVSAKRDATTRFRAIAETWKTIGHVPRERMDELFGRWRQVSDAFYGQMRSEFAERDQQQHDNLARKEALVVSAERLADDAAKALAARTGMLTADDVRRRIDQLFNEWTAVGHVPMTHKESLWTRFRTATGKARAVVEPAREAAPAAGAPATTTEPAATAVDPAPASGAPAP